MLPVPKLFTACKISKKKVKAESKRQMTTDAKTNFSQKKRQCQEFPCIPEVRIPKDTQGPLK